MEYLGTLASHGFRWRLNGLPSWDDDGEMFLPKQEPKWSERYLNASQRAELEALIAEHRAARPQDDPQMVRAGNMEHNGVECSHLHGTSLLNEKVPTRGFECHTCRAMIAPLDPPEVFRFVGGPLDGYYLATRGAPTWFVPLPQPTTVAATSDPLDGWASRVVEYERRGNVYVLRDQPARSVGATSVVALG